MEILITIGENGEKVIANDEICPGFYITEDSNVIERNNQIVGIKFDARMDDADHQNKVSKFESHTFATTKAKHGYLQHILAPTIDKEGFNGYLNSLNAYPEVQKMLLSAYSLIGNITLGPKP